MFIFSLSVYTTMTDSAVLFEHRLSSFRKPFALLAFCFALYFCTMSFAYEYARILTNKSTMAWSKSLDTFLSIFSSELSMML